MPFGSLFSVIIVNAEDVKIIRNILNYAGVYIKGKKSCMAVTNGQREKKEKAEEDAVIKGEAISNGPRGYLYS